MNAVVRSITPGSPASRTRIAAGDVLLKINGNVINDVLDYKYNSYDSDLMLELSGTDGKLKLSRIRKTAGSDIGLEFETFLMDKERSCANKCVFCFIDQLPAGMRESLYYKDDDVRLSLFQGNYVTLTNLSQTDIDRISKMRVSPVNVSVHTLDPELRSYMLGTKRGKNGISALKTFAEAGITLNCQIVCCPGINDGIELSRTIERLYSFGKAIKSVSVVPVGLTKHRQGLAELRPFDRALALKTVRQVEHYSGKCLKERGTRVFFCADELYMMAGLKLPAFEYYEDFPQLENGVGMMRLFINEFLTEFGNWNSESRIPNSAFSLVTGVAAGKYLTNLLKISSKKYDRIKGSVFAVRNDFFGESVTVSGLVTGGDIINQLRGRVLGERLLIPQNMLRHGENVFLDDTTLSDVSDALGIELWVVKQDGADLCRAFMGS